MTIREEYLSMGYSNEEIDYMVKKAYERRVEELPDKKKFEDTKIGYLLTNSLNIENLADRMIRRLAWKLSTINSKDEIPEFKGDRNNPIEVYEYNARYGIMPVETIDKGNDNYTHIYEDGTEVNIHVTTTSVFNDEMFNRIDETEKRFFADYLDMSEEELLNMTDDEIDKIIFEKEKRENKVKLKKLGKI